MQNSYKGFAKLMKNRNAIQEFLGPYSFRVICAKFAFLPYVLTKPAEAEYIENCICGDVPYSGEFSQHSIQLPQVGTKEVSFILFRKSSTLCSAQ